MVTLMNISIFDLFKIGIGPSSSHTVGPMLAAKLFVDDLSQRNELDKTANLRIELFGSLGATGRGHGTGPAVILGLEGNHPADIDPNYMPQRLQQIEQSGQLNIAGKNAINFQAEQDLHYIHQALPQHPNAMRITAKDPQGIILYSREYFSIGGGFILDQDQIKTLDAADVTVTNTVLPYPFNTMDQLLALCKLHQMSISQIMMANETCHRSEPEIR